MKMFLIATVTCLGVSSIAYAGPELSKPFKVAQVSEGATGGRSGGPNPAQYVVPEGSTGGRSGGPNQAQYVKKHHRKAKH